MNRNHLIPCSVMVRRAACVRAAAVLAAVVMTSCWHALVLAQEAVATITELRGSVLATQAGSTSVRRLAVNAPLYAADRVTTARNARATIQFKDETELRLAERTVINIDAFSYDSDPASQRADQELRTSVLTGVVRTLTGLLARRAPERVRFSTPAATIGVRGTHFVTQVDGEEVTVVLLEQETAATQNAVVVANDQGSVEVDRSNWGTTVANANTAPTPPREMRPQTMNRILRNIDTTRRIGAPRMPVR